MTSLVVCVDRSGDITAATGIDPPVLGWEAVQSLVLEAGLVDPEDSVVNALLECLHVARDLRDEDEDVVVAVVSGGSESMVGADRDLAEQLDEIVERHDPDSAVVVVDSAVDEQVIPLIESRMQVDSVDRVVVRQARDIESTYYMLKQFLADEELRGSVLVPLGVVLLVFPALLVVSGVAIAAATITGVIGAFALYKGLGVDAYVDDLPAEIRDALYSGRVSIVTYAVAAGLTLVGFVAGVLSASQLPSGAGSLLVGMAFAHDSVPWLALAALAATTGRLIDGAIRGDGVLDHYLNLPVGVVALGLVVRGFSAYFLQRAGTLAPIVVEPARLGPIAFRGLVIGPTQRLAVFVLVGVLVSLIGIWLGGSVDRRSIGPEPLDGDEPEDAEPRD